MPVLSRRTGEIRKTGTRFLPESETLTEKRIQDALTIGIPRRHIQSQWERMADCEFKRPYRDWDKVWRNWCRNALEWGTVLRVVERPKTEVSAAMKTRLKLDQIFRPIPEVPDDAA